MDFGRRLRREREARDWSRAQLGRMVGVSGRQIARYEEDGAQPALSVAAKLAQKLDLSLDELAGFKPAAFTPPAERRRSARDAAAPEAVMLALLRSLDGRLSQLERALTERGAQAAPRRARRAG